jgi:hypothetical protein
MFLFRTSAPSEARPANPVMAAIREGAARTGVDFDYLVRTAQRESSLDPGAKASTSSATGLFQFIEQTWLSMVRSEGPRHGLGEAANAITQAADGRLSIADPKLRDEIMALRRDPTVAATMAGALTQRNREQLMGALGREPTAGDLYIAHVMGTRGAQALIGAAASEPDRVAARAFPEAAAANRAIFFDRAGRARTMREVHDVLSASHRAVTGTVTSPVAGAAPGATATAPDRPGLLGLFSTEGARRPVSEAVARLWSGQRAAGVQIAALDPPARFFPRSASDAVVDGMAATAPPAGEAEARLVTAPTPPERLAALSTAPSPRRAGKPLDLAQFLNLRPR